MRHYVYKTTCLINNKYYYGVHTEKRESDGYIGCGVVSQGTANNLKSKGVKSYFIDSVVKYGYKNFKKEILREFENVDDAYLFEESLITDEELNNSMCMNIKRGGAGGVVPSTCVRVTIIDCEDEEEYSFDSLADCANFLGLKNISKAKRFHNSRYVKKHFAEPVSLKNIKGEIFNFADVVIASKKINVKPARIRQLKSGERNSANGYFLSTFDFNSKNWQGAKKYKK
jgi:hypothetical protein